MFRSGSSRSTATISLLPSYSTRLWVLAGTFSVVLVPVVLALIAASLLAPEAHLMSTKVRWMPHAVATAIVVIGGLAVVGGVFTGVVFAPQQLPIGDCVQQDHHISILGREKFQNWNEFPLHVAIAVKNKNWIADEWFSELECSARA